jgi:hypothetical protein
MINQNRYKVRRISYQKYPRSYISRLSDSSSDDSESTTVST